MTNMIVNVLLLMACLTKVSWSQTTLDPDHSLDCTLGGVNITNIEDGYLFIINQTIYDNIQNRALLDTIKVGDNVKTISLVDNRYVSIWDRYNDFVRFQANPVDETTELSRASEHFYYNFTILIFCGANTSRVDALIPIQETNTYTPIFSKKVYEYTLFSPLSEDLDRLLEINPITANDNDMSNTEVIFSIEGNKYFDVKYGGVIPGTLNKNHSGHLIPKNSTTILSETLQLTLFVMDLGQPRKSSNATLIVRPANVNYPTFKEAFYIGHYYFSNNSFAIKPTPELELFPINYNVQAKLTGALYPTNINSKIEDNKIIVQAYNLPELSIYKYSYLVYTLTVTFADKSFNNYKTTGNATIIVELHA